MVVAVVPVSIPVLRGLAGTFRGKVFEIRATVRLGRHPYNDLSVADPAVSRYHCWITCRDGSPVLEDLASGNGTYLNGLRIQGRAALKRGDRILLGSTEFVFSERE